MRIRCVVISRQLIHPRSQCSDSSIQGSIFPTHRLRVAQACRGIDSSKIKVCLLSLFSLQTDEKFGRNWPWNWHDVERREIRRCYFSVKLYRSLLNSTTSSSVLSQSNWNVKLRGTVQRTLPAICGLDLIKPLPPYYYDNHDSTSYLIT